MDLLRGVRRSRDETKFDLFITSDANSESGVGEVAIEICGPTRKHFSTKHYGHGLRGIGVVLMCRDPELNFKQRLRLSRKDKRLSMDIMLDLTQMRGVGHERRKQIISRRLAAEVPAVVRKYSIGDFDDARFAQDLKAWLTEIGGTSVSLQTV